MSENNTVIKVNNVTKRFNIYSRNIDRIKGVLFNREPAEVKYAVNHVSLEVNEGERLIVTGVVDSGRSTLIKVIAGVTSPSQGKVDIFDKTMNVMLEAKVGMDMEFSCRDNIFMKANIVGLTKEEIAPYVDEILEFAEVTDFADLPLKRAPKGTYAMLSLAVHLHKDADILIVDEVFGGGGNYISTKCEKRLTEHLEQNPQTTAVIVSNRAAFSKGIGTRAVVLEKGQIELSGNVEEATKLFQTLNKRNKR